MYTLYRIITFASAPIITSILRKRLKAGKELTERVLEKKAIITKPRPEGKLIWLHAASVGEAQSTLIIINTLLELNNELNILVTTGTITSAKIMADKLPTQAFHQFYPLDHPKWTAKFITHWKPDAVIWMESELWPNMLYELKYRSIPAVLVNAHMSQKSFDTWKNLKPLAKKMLTTFDKILCQNETDKLYFEILGGTNITVTDNLKYSASPLSYNPPDLQDIKQAIGSRTIWLYASTHDGEEELACKAHLSLKKQFPDILTVIVPRHPERREQINDACKKFELNIKFRGIDKHLPNSDDDVYIADTLGELGLFYRLSPIACIGRSFSNDGGGGHNPIEAAQLNCAVLHGKNVQNLQDIFDEMDVADASLEIDTPAELSTTLARLLNNENDIKILQDKGRMFSNKKNGVIDKVMSEITPILISSGVL